jgi:hypothetical protein
MVLHPPVEPAVVSEQSVSLRSDEEEQALPG